MYTLYADIVGISSLCIIARDGRLELTDTHTQTKYCNLRCAYVLRVNHMWTYTSHLLY